MKLGKKLSKIGPNWTSSDLMSDGWISLLRNNLQSIFCKKYPHNISKNLMHNQHSWKHLYYFLQFQEAEGDYFFEHKWKVTHIKFFLSQ